MRVPIISERRVSQEGSGVLDVKNRSTIVSFQLFKLFTLIAIVQPVNQYTNMKGYKSAELF